MIYVNERKADSICDTALEFLVMKSEYIPSHFGGMDSTSLVRWVACLYIAGAPMDGRMGGLIAGGGDGGGGVAEAGSRESGEVTFTFGVAAEVHSDGQQRGHGASD
jgi:hypothetical protein